MLKKGNYSWIIETQDAFEALKQAMIYAPVLVLLDLSKIFVAEIDAFGGVIGTVLMQEGHPIAFISKAVSEKKQGLSTNEKEQLAILFAIKQWEHCLMVVHFIIRTDYMSLKYLLE